MLAMELGSSTYNLWLDFKWANKRSLPTDKSKFWSHSGQEHFSFSHGTKENGSNILGGSGKVKGSSISQALSGKKNKWVKTKK